MTQFEYKEDERNLTSEKLVEIDDKINNYLKRNVKINSRIRVIEKELSDIRFEKRQIQETIESLGFRKSWTEYGIEEKERDEKR